MRITQLQLDDFTLLRDSNISHLVIDYTENLQLILGTNGSGKSSVCRQLSTTPTSRSLFDKKGMKSLTIENEQGTYRLESDYSKPSSPHSFIDVDTGENLNIGHTTDEQKVLVNKHLGITPLVDDLIMNRIHFPSMLPSKRKEFLMAHNPDDIGFVLTKAKQIASKIKACKNNLNRLQGRKIILEQDLLSPESLESLQEEKKSIEEDLGHFQKILMDIEVGLRTIGPVTLPHYDPKDIKKRLAHMRYAISDLNLVSRDDRQRQQDRDRLSVTVASIEQQIITLNDTLLKSNETLHDLELRYRELAPDGDLRDVENSITRLEADRDRLKTEDPQFKGNRDTLTSLYQQWEVLRDKLKIFETCEVPLYPRAKRQRREQVLAQAGYRKNAYEMTLQDLRSQYSQLSKRNTIAPKDIPETRCAKLECPLYAQFMGDYTHAQERRDEIHRKAERIKHRLTWIDLYLERGHSYFKDSNPYHEIVNWLVEESRSNPVLHLVLRNIDLLTVLKVQPNRISSRLKDHYDHIDRWFRYSEVLHDLDTAYALRSRMMGSQNEDTVKLVVTLEAVKKTISKTRLDIDKLTHDKELSQKQLEDVLLFDNIKRNVLLLVQNHESYVKLLAHDFDIHHLNQFKQNITSTRSQHFIRLGELERTLNAQVGLQARYQEEVVSQIEIIEKEMRDLEQIEKALLLIPKENIVDFVNDIFEQANRIIDTIWAIPFKIEPLDMDDPLDYTFQVSGDNQSLREMGVCSEGQTEVLSLAINLALRIQLGHVNTPLILDEVGRTLDMTHRRNLALMLKTLLDEQVISQLFIISHHAVFHESFPNKEIFVIREDNIPLPPEGQYNQHVTMR